MNLIYGTVASISDARRFVAHEQSQDLGNRPIILLHSKPFVAEFKAQTTELPLIAEREARKARALFNFYRHTVVLHRHSYLRGAKSRRVAIAALADTIASQWHDYAEMVYDAKMGGLLCKSSDDKTVLTEQIHTYWEVASLFCAIAYHSLLSTSIDETAMLAKLLQLLSALDKQLVENLSDIQLLQKTTDQAFRQLGRLAALSRTPVDAISLGRLECKIWETHHGVYSEQNRRVKDWEKMHALLALKWWRITANKQLANQLAKGIVSVSRKHDELLSDGVANKRHKVQFALHFCLCMSRVYADLRGLRPMSADHLMPIQDRSL